MATTHGEMGVGNAVQCLFELHMLLLALPLMLFTHAKGESAQEKQKGAEQTTSTATYLPYVGGSSIAPTPNCYMCICINIKDRDPSDLGLKINIASAFGNPSLCKAPDDFSQCPCSIRMSAMAAPLAAMACLYGGFLAFRHQQHCSAEGSSREQMKWSYQRMVPL